MVGRGSRRVGGARATGLASDPCAAARDAGPIAAPSQLIHGDLTENLLFVDGLAPAIIDVTPYFRPRGFAAAVVVGDAVRWRDADPDPLLAAVAHESWFPQLFVRAVIYRLVTSLVFGPYRCELLRVRRRAGRTAPRLTHRPVEQLDRMDHLDVVTTRTQMRGELDRAARVRRGDDRGTGRRHRLSPSGLPAHRRSRAGSRRRSRPRRSIDRHRRPRACGGPGSASAAHAAPRGCVGPAARGTRRDRPRSSAASATGCLPALRRAGTRARREPGAPCPAAARRTTACARRSPRRSRSPRRHRTNA